MDQQELEQQDLEVNKGSYEQDLEFLESIDDNCLRIKKGFVPNMRVEGRVFVDAAFRELLLGELRQYHEKPSGFLPALKQVANVASLPGIVGASYGLPDIHCGYGFAIGNAAGFDMDDPEAVVSPGGVGFDINCGVRFLRTNLNERDLDKDARDRLTKELYKQVPVGVGGKSRYELEKSELRDVLERGMSWAVEKGYGWAEDRERCEARGCIPDAQMEAVSERARERGFTQLGTLGSGNHYAEIQAVDEIYDAEVARVMGITQVGQLCVMIHSGSRGLGHQVATDALAEIDTNDASLNDRQLACARIHSEAGQKYLRGMAAAANFAFVNRTLLAASCRTAFSNVFGKDARELDMHVVYDVAHNIAKVEEHEVAGGEKKRLLVHRKGSTRAFPPGHPELPEEYQGIGQPVLVGGSMGTFSYILVGTPDGMRKSLGSTCHGAGRALSRNSAKKLLDAEEVIQGLEAKGISIRVGSRQAITEEAPEAYKDVNQVVQICHSAGISRRVLRLRPIGVIKG